jgi:asparagine synthase (glutamine-hydrolysing)
MERRVGDKSFVIVYNGELYNTQELRDQLKERGYEFQSYSDTETLLVSYIEWGPECVKRLNGIFAFGIWDEMNECLFLARDRFGVKPLFYVKKVNALLFGSEIKALLAHPDVHPCVDEEGLAEIFALGPTRTPGHGVFRDIKELKPGYCMLYTRRGINAWRYWALESLPHTDDVDTTAFKVRELLQDAVERQLIADVPVCTLLSGGLDSSALTAFAAQAYDKKGMGPLHTFSIEYAGNESYFRPSQFQPDSDERWVRLVSEFVGTYHHTVKVDTRQLVNALATAVRARDLPGMADIDSSLYLLFREVKKYATVAISGECADEIFGGYPWFHREDLLQNNTFPWSRFLDKRLSVLSKELRSKIDFKGYVDKAYGNTLAEVPYLDGEDWLEKRRREMFYLNITWFMAQLLERKDRMSMATGLEVRVPFCDHRLVEYVWNIPWEMKTWGQREKGILRRALEGVLPKPVLNRKKNPYPKTYNPSYTQAVVCELNRIISCPSSPLVQLIDVAAVKALLEEVMSSQDSTPWFGQLMTGPQFCAYLIQVDMWLRQYGINVVI